ncbi:hypothetical protein INS49_011732 [Diaporthe citri]|uniref:uncharacterized protein n=1 Tax=Diaporthe citri TaxID=83186 RepID=UPI001C80B94A|nr:uncharacterized protein INS49_011732 [Diaporthe citri]KAG6360667.1 hypothetical protein INS49_011732 [Diaporthe citri]
MTKSVARTRSLPFLHRNWIIAINYLQSATVGFKSDDSHSKLTNGHDDHYARPAKRRRFAESSPDSGIGQDIDSLLLPSEPGEIQRAVRIEVLKIAHKDLAHPRLNPALNGTIPPATKDATSIRARCKITITTARHTPGEVRSLYCDSQICTIKTFQNLAGLSQMARVYLPQPFHIPEEKIYVERDDDAVFDLADQYSMFLELESAGDRNWPPLNLVNTNSDEDVFLAHSTTSRHWTLAAEIPKIIDGGRRSGFLRLHKGAGQGARTDFVLDIDVRATTALPERPLWNNRERISPYSAALADQQDEPPPVTNGHVNGAQVDGNLLNGNLTNGHPSLVEDDMEEEAEDKYVEGDDSWVKSRLGPHNDDGPVVPAHKASQTRTGQVRPSQRSGGRRKEKKVLVPETKQPLFDSLSKAKLIPGTEVRQSVADDTWLIQKHRDIVQDFIDVDAAEKDYIKQWDAFIHKRHISSDAFISRAVLEFVNEKMQWLLSSQSRIQEFGKHLTVLIARGLDDDTVRQVQSRIQEARSQKPPETEQVSSQQPPKEGQHRSSKGCAVCGRNVRGPQLLICSNEDCKKPLYHEDCVKDKAQIPVEHQDWRCNECASSQAGYGS